jgi:amino acid adenylation domain-containing protein
MLQESSTNLGLPDISAAKRRLLEKYLLGVTGQPLVSSRTINRRPAEDPPRVSFAQERLWFLDQLLPGSPVFNVPLAVRLSGPIDQKVLEASINEIVRRHEMLRTTFATVNSQPVPVVAPELRVALRVFDLADVSGEEFAARARQLANEEAKRPFDLVHGPLIRASLIRHGDHPNQLFLITMHHICSDGWSLVLFFEELSELYKAFSSGSQSPLEELSIQYSDYVGWQREWLPGEVLKKQLGYWKEKLGGELPVLNLPTDRPRPMVQTYNGARVLLALSEQHTAALETFSRHEGATLFMTLLAAFKVLLYRYTGQSDLVVGLPIANRPQTETEGLIGFFLNNLALRTNLDGNPTFQEVLSRVRQTALDAYAHQDVPFEKLIEELKPERDLSRTTIFQVYFNLFNFADEIKLPGSPGPGRGISFFEAWAQSDEHLSKFDLTLYAGQQDEQLHLAFVYNTDLFEEASIKEMLDHFRALLEIVVANPQAAIGDCLLTTDAETRKGPNSGRIPSANAFTRPVNSVTRFEKREIEQSIPDRFAAQVRRYAKKTAVKSRNYEWSYAQLDQAANRVAHSILKQLPAQPQAERIALLFEHDAPMIAGLLGTLKAGKTYVPLDPSYPKHRLAHILEDSQASALLTNTRNVALAGELAGRELPLINIDSTDPNEVVPDINVATDSYALAYLLYTSGSTGRPKGVMQNHRNVLHFIQAYTNNLHLSADDRLTLLSSYCFDASVMDIYGALLNGATLYPVDIKEEGFAGLSEWISREGITIYHSTPTVYRYFAKTRNEVKSFPRLRLVVLGGEQVNRADVDLYKRYFSDECLLVNGLGPTEATVSLQYFIDKQTHISGQGVPVGYPVEDTEILLLDEAGQPAETRGEIQGEIAIKCEHVALGYWRNQEATEAAFPAASQAAGSRMYRTGDMGRKLPDGSIVFTGRKDFQIKVRGFRVELGEIEAALAQHTALSENVVVLKSTSSGDRLTAYVVPNSDVAVSENELREFLRHKLPEYMLPASFVVLDSLPLTASGKLNRRALPEPGSFSEQTERPTSLVQTPAEKRLAKIWAEVLGVDEVGMDDNFFELGGHSLMAVLLFARILLEFGKRLPLATLFQAPTVAQLAAVIQKQGTSGWSSIVPIQAAGSRPPFFCVHAKGGNVLEYYDLARHLGADQPFYGLQSLGLDSEHEAHTRIPDMATHYIKEMREIQPVGPYFIGGRSMGGTIAFEMACQLRETGEEVGLLALLDTYPVGYAKLLPATDTTFSKVDRVAKRISCHFSNMSGLSLWGQSLYLAEKLRFVPSRLKTVLWRRLYRLFQKLDCKLPRVLRDVKEFNSVALHDYGPRIYQGEATLFWASGDLRGAFDLVEGWRILTGGGMDVHEVSGNHLNIIKEPYVTELAVKLKNCLERASAQLASKLNGSDRTSLFNEPNREGSSFQQMKKAS